MNSNDNDSFNYPVDGILDLHMFKPTDTQSVVREYIEVCRARGILRIRVIHGKGTGALKRIVQSELARNPMVRSFFTADDASGWGAVIVELEPQDIPNN